MALGRGKWTKYKLLIMSPLLREALPDTQILNKNSFHTFIKKYIHVIVKPSNGSGGDGVMQVLSEGNGTYMVQYGKVKKKITGLSETYRFIRRKANRTYLIQQRIPLAQVNGKPFDLRVMVQKKRGSDWAVTGTLAKIAGSGYFITNIVRSKGKAVPLHTAISQSNIHGGSIRHIQNQINKLALNAAKHLQKHYRLHTIGLDVGVDTDGKIWLIEVNFRPDKTYFYRLKDKSMYKRIMTFYRNR